MPGLLEGDIEGTHFGLGMLRQRFLIDTGIRLGTASPEAPRLAPLASPIVIDGMLLSLVTPVDAEHVDIRFAFTLKRLETDDATAMVSRMMFDDIVRDVEDDIRIWQHKVYLTQPLLCDGDGPIGPFRKWARRFYGDQRAAIESAGAESTSA